MTAANPAAVLESYSQRRAAARSTAPSSAIVPAATARPVRMPGELVRELASHGPVIRLETGIPTLDECCRGGLPTRRLVIIGGAPGAGKTTFVTSLAWQWATASKAQVVYLAVDEGPEGVISRIGQHEGISSVLIEERDGIALERLATTLDLAALVLLDSDDDLGTVEGAAALLAQADPDFPRVLVIDSVQTVRALGTDDAASPRERVDAVVRALKTASQKYGFLVLATCELARGAYRSRNVAEAINDLAAFKESGGIEYAAQTALVLRSVPDDATLIDVTVPKNRAYRRDPFRLRLDYQSMRFEEVDVPPPSAPSRTERPSTLQADVSAVFKFVLEQPGLSGLAKLRDGLRARDVRISNDRVGAAVAYLFERGAFEDRPEKGRPRWFGVPSKLEKNQHGERQDDSE